MCGETESRMKENNNRNENERMNKSGKSSFVQKIK